MLHRIPFVFALCFVVAGVAACSDDDNTQPTQDVSIAFGAVLGDADFESGVCTEGIGEKQRALNVSDLRFYISDVEARDENGDWNALELNDRAWQGHGVTLIDLADTDVELGSAGTNNYIDGTLLKGDYDRLRFTFGVPFEHNHSDFAVAPAPLNVGGMSWSWQGGRKFLRLDATPCGDDAETADVDGVAVHIGSTLCQGEMTNITHCDNPNRSSIELDWNGSDAVIFDVDALLQEHDVYMHTEETKQLCMADADDPDCESIHTALGIPFGDNNAPDQRVFSTTDQTITPHATGELNDDDGAENHDHH